MPFSRIIPAILLMLLLASEVSAEITRFRVPPDNVTRIVEAPGAPISVLSPKREAILLVEMEPLPPLSLIARPFHRLAGIRIDAQSGNRRRTARAKSISLRRFDRAEPVRVELPPESSVTIPVWSPTGRHFAFKVYAGDDIQLWIGDAMTGEARQLPGIRINDILGSGFDWLDDGVSLLVRLVPDGRGRAPEPPLVPSGPVIEESSGRVAKLRTFQDLLRNPHDEEMFRHYARCQLAIVHSGTGKVAALGEPGLYLEPSFSPNGEILMITRLKEPLSYRVPYFWFARRTELWNARGESLRVLADLPVSDDVPPQGVVTGPRNFQWQPLVPSTVLWVQALDDGDPMKKVPHRDALWRLDAASSEAPREILRVQHRFAGMDWLPAPGAVLLSEYDRDRRWRTTSRLSLVRPDSPRDVLFDLSIHDDYRDPGEPLRDVLPDGQVVLLADGDSIYLTGTGATPAGNRPFLDRFDLRTKKSERLFWSATNSLENVIGFVGDSREKVLIRHQTVASPPNLFIHDLRTGQRVALTDERDLAPDLTGVRRELLTYKRADGVPLSGMLYLPPGYREGERLPTVIWAYPYEYSDAATAGQVRGSPHSFAYYRGTSPLLFLTQGYAVLMDTAMPVVGDPETMNETYIEQVSAAAEAAINTLVERGVTDRHRILVAGHSYGAFMTANLLAHTDLFAAGIGRSGAYNRTLTPFGFQAERRSLWEAPEVYARISPFMHAYKINEPLLLIHGEADNNSGTFPIQSERLYQAIQGHGGTVRLVLLPHESHGYAARESVLHVIAEMFDWAERHVKKRRADQRQAAKEALIKAATFFHNKVAIENTYLWQYSDDLQKREGEGKVTGRKGWVQPPGTPAVGMAYLHAWEATRDHRLLDFAKNTAFGLLRGQLQSGGWSHSIELEPAARKKHAYVGQKPGVGRNTTTFDDDSTQAAIRFLVALDAALQFEEPRIREAIDHAVQSVLRAQYPNGAWPQGYDSFPSAENFSIVSARFPKSWSREWPGNQQYWKRYTLNDRALITMAETMLEVHEVYRNGPPELRALAKRCREAALKAGDFLLLAQLPEPQPVWAQQYDFEMQPAWARKFEPPSITAGESQDALLLLLKLYEETGEKKFIAPVPRALAYLCSIRLPDGQFARFYELETSRPLYFTREYKLTYDDSDLPTHYAFKIPDRTSRIEREYRRVIAGKKLQRESENNSDLAEQAAEVIAALDSQGRWIEIGRLRYHGPNDDTRRVIRGATFIRNVEILSRYLSAVPEKRGS